MKSTHDKWNEFVSNHQKLLEFNDFSDAYFKEEIFSKAEKCYNRYMIRMEKLLESPTTSAATLQVPPNINIVATELLSQDENENKFVTPQRSNDEVAKGGVSSEDEQDDAEEFLNHRRMLEDRWEAEAPADAPSDPQNNQQEMLEKMMSMMMSLTEKVNVLEKTATVKVLDKKNISTGYKLPTEELFQASTSTARPGKLEMENAQCWEQQWEGVKLGQPSGFHTGTNSFAQSREQALGGILTKVPQVGKVDQETTQQATSMSQSDQLAAKLIDVANAFSSINGIGNLEPALHKFDGTQNYRSWRMLFNKKVNEKKIPNVLKLEKLNFALKGDASQLISFIDITDDNYENALAILDARYYDPQTLMDREVDDFLKMQDTSFSTGKSKAQKMRDTYDITQRVFGNLKNLVQETKFTSIEEKQQPHYNAYVAQEILDVMAARLITTTLDARSNEKLQQFRSANGVKKHQTIKLADVLEFIQQEFRETTCQVVRPKPIALPYQHARNQYPKGAYQKSFLCNTKQCYSCNSEKHVTENCPQFGKLSVKERRNMARKMNLCYSCANYKINECDCKKRGNFKPHKMLTYPKEVYNHTDTRVRKEHQAHVGTSGSQNNRTTLLATARCVVLDKVGHPVILRALIDNGSTCSFITKQAACVLKLTRTQTQVSIQGIGRTHLDANEEVELTIKPHFKSSFEMKIDAIIVESISDQVPARRVHVQRRNDWPHPLADPSFDLPGKIDILLSATEMPWLLINNAIIEIGEPIMQETKLGFIIYGPTKENSCVNEARSFVITASQVKISDMDRFWEIEVEQEDDQSVEDFYMKTTVRNEDGSYTVQIPFKDEIPMLGESKGRAMARFLQNERKLGKSPKRLELYNSTLREYLQLGHMRLVTNQSLGKYYIPHQAVIKEDSVMQK